jgi:hypothetical protein
VGTKPVAIVSVRLANDMAGNCGDEMSDLSDEFVKKLRTVAAAFEGMDDFLDDVADHIQYLEWRNLQKDVLLGECKDADALQKKDQQIAMLSKSVQSLLSMHADKEAQRKTKARAK